MNSIRCQCCDLLLGYTESSVKISITCPHCERIVFYVMYYATHDREYLATGDMPQHWWQDVVQNFHHAEIIIDSFKIYCYDRSNPGGQKVKYGVIQTLG